MKEPKSKKEWTKADYWKLGGAIGVFIILIAISYYYLVKNSFHSMEEQGQFGDMFGVLNAVFSGFAFTGLIITILIQQRDLELQQKELRETREEFTINRITNIIYKQLDRVDKAVEEFVDDRAIPDKTGLDGLLRVHNLLGEPLYHWEPNFTPGQKALVVENRCSVYFFLENEYFNLAVKMNTYFQSVLNVILQDGLDIIEKNQLKNLFFENIPYAVRNSFGDINRTLELYDEVRTYHQFKWNTTTTMTTLRRVCIFLEKFRKYELLIIDEDNINELKKDLSFRYYLKDE